MTRGEPPDTEPFLALGLLCGESVPARGDEPGGCSFTTLAHPLISFGGDSVLSWACTAPHRRIRPLHMQMAHPQHAVALHDTSAARQSDSGLSTAEHQEECYVLSPLL